MIRRGRPIREYSICIYVMPRSIDRAWYGEREVCPILILTRTSSIQFSLSTMLLAFVLSRKQLLVGITKKTTLITTNLISFRHWSWGKVIPPAVDGIPNKKVLDFRGSTRAVLKHFPTKFHSRLGRIVVIAGVPACAQQSVPNILTTNILEVSSYLPRGNSQALN